MLLVAFASPVPLRSLTPRSPALQPRRPPALATMTAKPFTVGIAGAGVAGLSCALALLRAPDTGVSEVTIFEPRPSGGDVSLGAALNINGGAAILSKKYGVPLWPIARPMSHVRGFDTTGSQLFHVDVEKVVRGNRGAREMLMDEGRSLFMTVMREDLMQLLTAEAKKEGVVVMRGKGNKVVEVREKEEGASFMLASGLETETFDLVLGADGVRSKVRVHVDGETVRMPEYTGIRVAWAIAPKGVGCGLGEGELQQWFGNGGYALWYAAGPRGGETEMVVFSAREKKRTRENANYKSEEGIQEDLERRLNECGMPEVVMKAFGRGERFIETSVYQHGGISNWSCGGVCALVGDAAHAMPPFLGQGANQAIQDAHALALSLSSIGEKGVENVPQALKKYESMRKQQAEAVLQTSKIVGLLETQGGAVGSAARNTLFRAMGIAGVQGQALIQSAKPTVL